MSVNYNIGSTAGRGRLLVVSAPSGAGKGTVIGELRKLDPNIVPSISLTSREPRAGETEGVHYFFVPKERFRQMADDGGFVEWDEYQGNYYGTSKAFIAGRLSEGKDIVFDITIKGAFAIREQRPDAVLVFLVPPSFTELERRLRFRGTETEESLRGRLAEARREVEFIERFDYCIVNDVASEAAARLLAIATAEKNRVRGASDAAAIRDRILG
ncbi:MAG: guanylate kinase [Clostridiales bacterium]|jgi:guanylate kinase|nr:guanylate kinase [Clostridiales bacterium]